MYTLRMHLGKISRRKIQDHQSSGDKEESLQTLQIGARLT